MGPVRLLVNLSERLQNDTVRESGKKSENDKLDFPTVGRYNFGQTITRLEVEAETMEVRSVQAVFEDGVLRPSEDLGLQENERVRLIVTSEAEWQRKFAALLEQVQRRTDRFATEEIEADITAATHEN